MTGRATVTVVNASGVVLGSVVVNGTFTLNGASPTNASATTTSKGVATLNSPTYANVAGQTVQFCVTSLVRTGYLFDNSGPTCASFVS
jgi:hypothetical protein